MKSFIKQIVISLLILVTITSFSVVTYAADYDDPPVIVPTITTGN